LIGRGPHRINDVTCDQAGSRYGPPPRRP